MGKLVLSMIMGALLAASIDKWQQGDLSAAPLLSALHDIGRNTVLQR